MGEFELLAVVMVCAACSLAGLLTLKRHADNRLYETRVYSPRVKDARRYLNAAGLLWTLGVFALMIYGALSFMRMPIEWGQGVLWCAAALFVPITPAVAIRGWYLARLAWK